jgi:hypothetical protein
MAAFDYRALGSVNLQKKLEEWTSPEALLKDVEIAKKFWKEVSGLPVPDLTAESIYAAEKKLEELGIPTPFPAIDDKDHPAVILVTKAVKIMGEYEDGIVEWLIQSKTELALELIGMPEKFVLLVGSTVQGFLDWLFNRKSEDYAYWRVIVAALGATFFLLTIGPALTTAKTIFGGDLARIFRFAYNNRLPQRKGPRVRKVARARIGRQLQ